MTLFSAPNYCGEFDNAGAVMGVSEDLTCWFSVLPVRLLIEFNYVFEADVILFCSQPDKKKVFIKYYK